ncbi:AAC(3) family N-acetyltransferase [Alkalimonas sp. MEB108]|uniref:Aminoglycoside N(3)-acetyltransferase n=1 Tax=Alkalimonas cellulosilytica TaxID=3058395 RepID=A0ABU7J333_9GAMM|nr:AAC(3) family N-acetyltransferase [Alkalimonas sp. MEB108]MEE2000425.1 AAC(3) family N-acetyltransferase [Alkalimonas sp. MEB108]
MQKEYSQFFYFETCLYYEWIFINAMMNYIKRKLKIILKNYQRAKSAKYLKEQAPHISQQKLEQQLLSLGVAQGDTIFLHSSLKSLGYVTGGPAAVIAALQNAVGIQGNILLPAYYLPGGTIENTCKLSDYCFDLRIHGTNMGRLPETFLATKGVMRSLHPTHSVAAWGKDAKFLTEAHHKATSVFGKGSPWQRFSALPKAKVLGLGISMGPVTFYHLLEDTLGDKFPLSVWQQEHLLRCVDSEGKVWKVPVRPYDKVLTAQRIDHPSRTDLRDFIKAELSKHGQLKQGQVGAGQSWLINSQDFYQHLEKLANEGITIYSTPEQLRNRPLVS